MNGNDLMDALSGLDPKYIDEAAFELHGRPVKKSNPNKAKIMRGVFIALPVAAAALITVMVALPAIFRMGSTSAPSSDSSASYSASEAPSEPSWDYEAAEGPSWDYDAAETETAAIADSASEEASNASSSVKDEAISEAEEVGSSEAAEAETAESAEPSETETAGSDISAEYDNGILTIENLTLPEDVTGTEYVIAKKTATGTEITYSEGKLEDIMTETEPLTLDISELMLPEGTYTITIDGESIEFIV